MEPISDSLEKNQSKSTWQKTALEEGAYVRPPSSHLVVNGTDSAQRTQHWRRRSLLYRTTRRTSVGGTRAARIQASYDTLAKHAQTRTPAIESLTELET